MESAREAARKGRVEQLRVLEAYEAGKPVVFRVHNDPKGFSLKKEGEAAKDRSRRKLSFQPVDEMFDSAVNGDLDEVTKLVKSGVDVNAVDADGMTALHRVCVENHLNIASFLVLNGANVLARDYDWWTPLHAASSAGNWRVANYLISQGADPRQANSEGDLPIDVVSQAKVENILTQEMDRLGVQDTDLDKLRSADEKDMTAAIGDVIAAGKVNEKNGDGVAPIHIAACNGYIPCLNKILAAKGVDVNARDADGNTALHLASFFQQYEAVMTLSGHKASLDARNRHNEKPIVLSEDTTMIRLLTALEKKAKVEKPTSQLQKPRTASIRHSSRARKRAEQKKDAQAEHAHLAVSPS